MTGPSSERDTLHAPSGQPSDRQARHASRTGPADASARRAQAPTRGARPGGTEHDGPSAPLGACHTRPGGGATAHAAQAGPIGWSGLDTAAAAALSLAVYCLAHSKALLSPYVINDDVRQQLFWMQRWLDPGLYPPELLNQYAEAYVPWGVKLIYWLGSWFANPVQFSKVVAGALFVAQCLLLGGLGRFLGGRALGWAAVVSGWLMPFFLDNISGGLSRAFASPLLAGFALAWLTANARLLGVVLVAQALCIPYIFLPCGLAVLLDRGLARLRGKPGVWLAGRGQWAVFAAATATAGLFSLLFTIKGYGPLVSLADTAYRPEFGPLGRLELAPLPNPFLDFVYFPFEGIGLFKELGLIPGIVSLALLAVPVFAGARQADWKRLAAGAKPLWPVAVAFLVFYVAARAVAFALFVPDRYVQYPVNLFYALTLAVCLSAAWQGRAAAAKHGVLLVALCALAGAVRLQDVALYDLRAGQAVYAGVEAATPKEAMLAGHPALMDNVLTFSRRNALATFELAHCWSIGFWNRMSPRLEGFFAAYYASDLDAVAEFARRFGVDFLVVDEAHFTPEFLANRPFFEPFGQSVKLMTKAGRAFVLLDSTQLKRTALKPGVFLIDLKPLR